MGAGTEVLGVGQSIVDIHLKVPTEHLAEFTLPAGEFALVTPTEQERVIARLAELGLTPEEEAGGSVVNSVVTAATLKGKAELISRLGRDERGTRFLREVREHGVTFEPLLVDGSTAASLVVVGPDGQRIMRTTLGVASTVDRADIAPERLQAARWVILEAYMLHCQGGPEALQHALDAAHRGADTFVALTLSDSSVVRDHYDLLLELVPQCDLIFANKSEALTFAGTADLPEALRRIGRLAWTTVVTAGPEGAYVIQGDRVEHIPGHPAVVIDTTGAGDAFAGALLTALVRDISLHRAVDGAHLVASRVVAQLGVRVPPPAVAEWADRLGIRI